MDRQALYILRYSFQSSQEDIPLFNGTFVIGRASECNLTLKENDISRRHTQIDVSDSGCSIMDLGSVNGTRLEGQPLQPRRKVPIYSNQQFQIQEHHFLLLPINEYHGQLLDKDVVNAAVAPWSAKTILPGSAVPPIISTPEPVRTLALRYRKENGPWDEISLTDGEYIIGRQSSSQIVLDTPAVSRSHARLTVQGDQISLGDLGSRNGVIREGQRLPSNQPITVQPGDKFQIDLYDFELFWKEQVTPVSYSSSSTGTVVMGEVSFANLQPQAVPSALNLAGSDRVTIGRALDNQIKLDHPLISRYHAVIERLGTRSRIINLHSANGVFLNGQKIEHMSWIKPGDSIKLGPYQFQYSGTELFRSEIESYTIDAIGLNKWVSKTVNLLKDISLSVGQNEFVALVGMSGAGKSTLMDAINGFRPATQGEVLINGIELYENYNMFRDDIGNVPQRDIVHMELTPEQALGYAARLRMPRDTSSKEREKAIQETLGDLGLTGKKDIPISRLSGGQLKRVSIGVELLTKPRLFFLDEPTSGLDPGTEYEMMKLLRHLADQGRTIMIITHATKNVMYCDKAIILARGGNLAFYGPPEEALEYFDQFRTHREKLEKDMEFDDIYQILNDDLRGKPEDWRDRFLQSQYARYVQPQYKPTAAPSTTHLRTKPRQNRISAISQFFILSSRNIKCMSQDKATLFLTLALAPVLGLMNFIWGQNLFDPIHGDAVKVMMIWFVTTFIAILVGAMGSVREIVKEADIYKRERAVGLKIFPYVLSKAWIGMALAVYQGCMILLFVILLAQPTVLRPFGYPALAITIILGVISGYMLGLLVSAIVPNQNASMTVLIAFLVPQLLFAGVLMPLGRIPLGEVISPFISSRWVYEAFVNSTGLGIRLVEDSCWNLPKDQRNQLTSTDKEKCQCMGPSLFKNCALFPGIMSPNYYDEAAKVALAQGEPARPVQPSRLPSPTPLMTPTQLPTPTLYATPTRLSTPTPPPTPTRLPVYVGSQKQRETKYAGLSPEEQSTKAVGEAWWRAKKYEDDTTQQFDEYRITREAQFGDYQNQSMQQLDEYKGQVKGQLTEYQEQVKGQVASHIDEQTNLMTLYGNQVEGQFNDYANNMQKYGNTLSDWEKHRQEAIGSAETILAMVYDDFGRAFRGTVIERWIYIIMIILGEFIIILILQKRKDVV